MEGEENEGRSQFFCAGTQLRWSTLERGERGGGWCEHGFFVGQSMFCRRFDYHGKTFCLSGSDGSVHKMAFSL